LKEKFLLATFLDLKPKVTLYFPKLCMLFFLVLQLWDQSKYLGFGKQFFLTRVPRIVDLGKGNFLKKVKDLFIL